MPVNQNISINSNIMNQDNLLISKSLTEYSTLDTHFYKIYEFDYDKNDLTKGANVSIVNHPVGSCLKYEAKDYVPHICGSVFKFFYDGVNFFFQVTLAIQTIIKDIIQKVIMVSLHIITTKITQLQNNILE